VHLDKERQAWVQAGGQAESVLFGNTFRYPVVKREWLAPRIFVGGTSDRDHTVLDQLVTEVQQDSDNVELVIADGTGPRKWVGEKSTVVWLPVLAPEDFGRELSESTVTFMPLSNRLERSAGQMVAIGSLECGVPVVTTASPGLGGYVDGSYIRTAGYGAILPQLRAAAALEEAKREDVRRYWRTHYCLESYAKRVHAAVARHSVRGGLPLIRIPAANS